MRQRLANVPFGLAHDAGHQAADVKRQGGPARLVAQRLGQRSFLPVPGTPNSSHATRTHVPVACPRRSARRQNALSTSSPPNWSNAS